MSPGAAVVFTAAAYLLVKYFQFELELMDMVNLALMNLAVGYFYLKSGIAHRGIGFLVMLLVFLHPLAGLPLWDNESPSFFLFKAAQRGQELLFGGSAGPFAGLALSSIFVFFAIGSAFSWKQDQEARRQKETALKAE
jgi:hypothetical protein